MTLTVWRGDRLLGELRPHAASQHARALRPDKPPSVWACLIPTVEPAYLASVSQFAFPMAERWVVLHHPLDPDIVAERDRIAASREVNPGPIALEQLSPEEAEGVPPESQLTVRDAEGRVYLPRLLNLQEVHYGSAHDPTTSPAVPAEAFIGGSMWDVFVMFGSASDAPAT